MKQSTFSFLLLFAFAGLHAQNNLRSPEIDVSYHSPIYFDMRTSTREQMNRTNAEHHAYMLAKDPQWDLKRAQYELQVQQGAAAFRQNPAMQTVVTIPVVVHIIYNSAIQNVPDAAVFSQLQVLNEDFGRTAADTVDTPAPFAAIAANTGIQFCLAQRDPNGNPSTGIERRQTSVVQFSVNDQMKFYSQGGLDIWDPTRYLNIWVCYTGGVCYGEFPTANVSNTFGVVMNYFYFGSNYTSYGTFNYLSAYLDHGEIAVHEVGHCLNLYHIWGDDNGACSGTDYCNDTPNQADASAACMVYPAFDACSSSGNGYMFQNYMDYTDDDCLNLFTQDQSARMNAVLSMPPYDALTTSNGCQMPALYTLDAAIVSILSPDGNFCSGSTFIPAVVLRNWGTDTLVSCTINYFIDANVPTIFNWVGSIPFLGSDTIFLSSMAVTAGTHTFTAYSDFPNAGTDQQPANDQRVNTFSALGNGIALPFSEGFEGYQFVPAGWTRVNPDASNTWLRTTLAASSGLACAMMDNIGYYNGYGQVDEMIMPTIDLSTVANPNMAFDVAYTYYHQTNPVRNYTDTLTVLISTDCGQTFSVIYKKGGMQLATVIPGNNDNAFIPTTAQWQTKYIHLAPYQFCPNAIIKFRNTSDWGNEMYIDNVNIGNELAVPVFSNENDIDLYPNPAGDKLFINLSISQSQNVEIRLVDMTGRIISTDAYAATNGGTFSMDLSSVMNGIYFIDIITEGKVITKKFIVNK